MWWPFKKRVKPFICGEFTEHCIHRQTGTAVFPPCNEKQLATLARCCRCDYRAVKPWDPMW